MALERHAGRCRAGPARARATHDVLERSRARGALFFHDLVAVTGRLGIEVTDALWDLVARGLVTADGFRERAGALQCPPPVVASRRAPRAGGAPAAERPARGWRRRPLGPRAAATLDERRRRGDARAEAVAEQLLARWGVVFRDLVARETLAVSWREILWAFRRLEARGTIRGGRFVTGFVGEQYALPDAVEGLRDVRRRQRSGETVRVAAVDPLNLVGILTPGPRVRPCAATPSSITTGCPRRQAAPRIPTPPSASDPADRARGARRRATRFPPLLRVLPPGPAGSPRVIRAVTRRRSKLSWAGLRLALSVGTDTHTDEGGRRCFKRARPRTAPGGPSPPS